MKKEVKNRTLFALKEAQKALGYLAKLEGFDEALAVLEGRKGKVITCGVGKSSYVAMKFAATLTSLDQEALYIHPTDVLHGGAGAIKKGDVLVVVSSSGESAELLNLTKYLKDNLQIKVVSIVGNRHSRLVKLSDATILAKIDEEGCPLSLAPMASTTAALVAADMLAAALTEPHPLSRKNFARNHPSGSLGLKLKKVKDHMDSSVPVGKSDLSLARTLKVITDKGRGVVAVTDKTGKMVGIITDGDVRRFLLKSKSIENHTAASAMTRRPKTISAEASLFEALGKMNEYSITSLFVLDRKSRPVGLIHIHDILGQS